MAQNVIYEILDSAGRPLEDYPARPDVPVHAEFHSIAYRKDGTLVIYIQVFKEERF